MNGPLDKLPNIILVALIFCFFTVAYGYLKMAGYGGFIILLATIASMTYLIRKAWRYTPKRNRQTS